MRLGVPQQIISGHLSKMLIWANPINSDLKQGFTVPQIAEKHGRQEPLVWSLAWRKKQVKAY